MASETTHLGLIKPSYTEKFDIMTINLNMDTLDAAVSANDAGKIDKPSGVEANKYLRTGTNGTLEWGDVIDQASIGPTVTAWLDGNIPKDQTVLVDNSLSMAHAAADAKVTGTRISAVEDAVDNIADELPNIRNQISSRGIPTGGARGEYLVKASDNNYDVEWVAFDEDDHDEVEFTMMNVNSIEFAFKVNTMNPRSFYNMIVNMSPDEYVPEDGDILLIRATADLTIPQNKTYQFIRFRIVLRGTQGDEKILSVSNSAIHYPEASAGKNILNQGDVIMLRYRTVSVLSGEFDIIGKRNGTSDYTDLINKPRINNVELTGNKTLGDLGILPAGGAAGRVLTKASNNDFDVQWAESSDIPAGGAAGQVLKKASNSDYDYMWADESGGGGGSGGTTDYNNLTNKPRIGGTTLAGNKTLSDLGIASASDVIMKPTTTGTAGQVLGLDNSLNPVWVNQQGGGSGTTNYNDLTNKPQINGTTLSGNKTLSELGVHNIPSGGTVNQVLAKNSGTDYDLKWMTLSGGGGVGFTPNYVTPEDYGAVGDGTTDDTNAISQAFNSGMPVVLTKGKNYHITQAEITHPLIVYGNDATISTESAKNAENVVPLFTVRNEATEFRMYDVNFYTTADQTVHGAHPNDPEIPNRSVRSGMLCFGVDRLVISGCKFTNFDNPIRGTRTSSDTEYIYIPQNTWIINCRVDNALMGILGFFKNVVVSGCEFNMDVNAQSGEHGIYFLIDATETAIVSDTTINTYHGACGSCIQFYPSSVNLTLPTLIKREYRIDNCIFTGDSYISNRGGGQVYASACTMKAPDYSSTNRRRQFECNANDGSIIEVIGSNVNLELQDSVDTKLIFRDCNVYSHVIMSSERMSLYRGYNTQFDNIAFRLTDGGQMINCTFSATEDIVGLYYLTVPATTTSSLVTGCVFNTGVRVSYIAYGCVGTCSMINVVSSLPTGNDNTGLTIYHKIDPTQSEPGGGGASAEIVNNRLVIYTGGTTPTPTPEPDDGYTIIASGTRTIQKDAGDDYSYILFNDTPNTISVGEEYRVTFPEISETFDVVAKGVNVYGNTQNVFGNPGVTDPTLDDGSGIDFMGFMYNATTLVLAIPDQQFTSVTATIQKKTS